MALLAEDSTNSDGTPTGGALASDGSLSDGAYVDGAFLDAAELELRRAEVARELGPRYHVTELLGRGAFASVWLAYDRVVEGPVAVKRFETLADDSRGRNFYRELRALFRLDSRRIVRLLNLLETDDGRRCLFVEYCAGGSMRPLLAAARRAGRRLPESWAASIVRQIAEGLSEAHALGLAHRDLKPENILFERPAAARFGSAVDFAVDEAVAPDVKLADFGLAAAYGAGCGDEPLRGLSGSPAYMAPEQFASETRLESDFYALGVVAYELLHGRPPFQGSPGELARQHCSIAPALDPRLPPAWRELISGLLEKDPRKRPAAASWVFDRLGGGGPTAAASAKPPRRGGVRPAAAGGLAVPALFERTAVGAVAAAVSASDEARLLESLPEAASPQAPVLRWTGAASARALVVGDDSDETGVLADDKLLRYRGASVASAGQLRMAASAACVGEGGTWHVAVEREVLRWTPGRPPASVHRLDQPVSALAVRGEFLAAATAERLHLFDHPRRDRPSASPELRTGGIQPRIAWRADGVCWAAEGPTAPRLVQFAVDGRRLRERPLPGACWQLAASGADRCFLRLLVGGRFFAAEAAASDLAVALLPSPTGVRLIACDPRGGGDAVLLDEAGGLWRWGRGRRPAHLPPPPAAAAQIVDMAVQEGRLLLLLRDHRGCHVAASPLAH